MFKLKTDDPKLFRQIMNAVNIIVEEATFKLTPEGISLKAMDPSRVAMVDLTLNKAMFTEYEVKGEAPLCLGLSQFLKLLRRGGGKDESMELSLEKEKLKIVFAKGDSVREFTLRTLEPEEAEVPTPKVTYNVHVKFTMSDLIHKVDDAVLVSDHVQIKATKEVFVLHAGGDFMTSHAEIKRGSESLLELEVKDLEKEVKATYGLSYLADILKSANFADIVLLEFSQDMPIKIDLNLPEGKLTYYLAPRIEVE